jgi:hypothetical protein
MADHFDAPMKFGAGQPVRRYEDVRLLTGPGTVNAITFQYPPELFSLLVDTIPIHDGSS